MAVAPRRQKIGPDYEPHKKLQDDAGEFLGQLGYRTCEATYHSVLEPEIKRVLQYKYNLTALYLRTRADRMAIYPHPNVNADFEYECKTHISKQAHDITVEALPLAHHILKARLGVRCLYCYRDPFAQEDYGFWINEIPPIRIVMVPEGGQGITWTEAGVQSFCDTLSTIFPKVIPIGRVHGSGDPFAIISESEKANLANWRQLIYNYLGLHMTPEGDWGDYESDTMGQQGP